MASVSLDPVSLYERILALVRPQELHRSSNLVLQEEFAALGKAVEDVAATFAKVEEVRDAVKQLEQGKPSAGRSASLMEAMDSTTTLQKKLKKKLQKVAAGMKVQLETMAVEEKKRGKEKRKRGEELMKEKEKLADSSESSIEEKEEVTKPKKHKRGKSEEHEDKQRNIKVNEAAASDRKKSADLHLAHEALTAITKVKVVNRRIQFDIKDKWVESLFDVKRILKNQSIRDADTTDNAAAEVGARVLKAAVPVFKKLEWTTENVKEVRSLIAALTHACSMNEKLRVYFYRVQAQLKSLAMSIPRFVTETSGVSGNAKLANMGISLLAYHNLVNDMHGQPLSVKPKWILEALIAIQQVMKDDFICVHQEDVRASVGDVSRWISDVPLQNDIDKEYARFAKSITAYSRKLQGKQAQAEWQRLATSVLTMLDEKRKQPQPVMTSHSPSPVSKKTKEVQGRLISIMTQVEEWQDGIFSLDQLDKLIKALEGVLLYKSKTWSPLTGPDTRVCVEKLISCIQKIKMQAHREKRLKKVLKWKNNMDKQRH